MYWNRGFEFNGYLNISFLFLVVYLFQLYSIPAILNYEA